MLEWLIVGGGVHGTILSVALTTRGGVDADAIRVIDQESTPLAVWRRNTRSCGMKYLRSPGSHSIDSSFAGLRRWAAREGVREEEFLAPYFRPSLSVFDAHSDFVITHHQLQSLRIQDRVTGVKPNGASAIVECESGAKLHAKRVVMAVGRASSLRVPDWAVGRGPRVRHVFGLPYVPVSDWAFGRVLIVGGGITAAQLAVSCAGAPDVRSVEMLMPHEVRVRLFDSEPCYIGPRCLPEYLKLSTVAEKRDVLRRVRYPGSMPPYVAGELAAGEATGAIHRRVCSVHRLRRCSESHDAVIVDLDDGSMVRGDCLVLATGFDDRVPAEGLINQIAADYSAPVDEAGFPIPELDLRWGGESVYVSGVLGELVLGPTAGNIIGAHIAARRLVARRRSVESIPWTWREVAG